MTVEQDLRRVVKKANTTGRIGYLYLGNRHVTTVRTLLASANRHAGMAIREEKPQWKLWYTAVEKAYRRQAVEIARKELQ